MTIRITRTKQSATRPLSIVVPLSFILIVSHNQLREYSLLYFNSCDNKEDRGISHNNLFPLSFPYFLSLLSPSPMINLAQQQCRGSHLKSLVWSNQHITITHENSIPCRKKKTACPTFYPSTLQGMVAILPSRR